eukprot:TRINITY_DN1035_c0_g1_i5.p1 TRINITY_DN1035_c0_g1~~TRINITY_DN1035_c0_g1_i5.p1  ORF type:complete len:148 (-),score=31.02 TRINITY_DN1035_c0_g1_i5:184-627(-)
MSDTHGWSVEKVVSKACKAYNNCFHSSIGMSPFECLYEIGDTVGIRNFQRDRFDQARWMGPAVIKEKGKYDGYYVMWKGKLIERNVQDIRKWKSKVENDDEEDVVENKNTKEKDIAKLPPKKIIPVVPRQNALKPKVVKTAGVRARA